MQLKNKNKKKTDQWQLNHGWSVNRPKSAEKLEGDGCLPTSATLWCKMTSLEKSDYSTLNIAGKAALLGQETKPGKASHVLC